jgi:hypothetical protein
LAASCFHYYWQFGSLSKHVYSKQQQPKCFCPSFCVKEREGWERIKEREREGEKKREGDKKREGERENKREMRKRERERESEREMRKRER